MVLVFWCSKFMKVFFVEDNCLFLCVIMLMVCDIDCSFIGRMCSMLCLMNIFVIVVGRIEIMLVFCCSKVIVMKVEVVEIVLFGMFILVRFILCFSIVCSGMWLG